MKNPLPVEVRTAVELLKRYGCWRASSERGNEALSTSMVRSPRTWVKADVLAVMRRCKEQGQSVAAIADAFGFRRAAVSGWLSNSPRAVMARRLRANGVPVEMIAIKCTASVQQVYAWTATVRATHGTEWLEVARQMPALTIRWQALETIDKLRRLGLSATLIAGALGLPEAEVQIVVAAFAHAAS